MKKPLAAPLVYLPQKIQENLLMQWTDLSSYAQGILWLLVWLPLLQALAQRIRHPTATGGARDVERIWSRRWSRLTLARGARGIRPRCWSRLKLTRQHGSGPPWIQDWSHQGLDPRRMRSRDPRSTRVQGWQAPPDLLRHLCQLRLLPQHEI